MIRRCKKNGGWVLIEILLGIVLLSIFLIYGGRYVHREHQKHMAQRLTNEMSLILSAATSYYIHEQDQWPQSISDLINKQYLDPQTAGATTMLNPYGQDYTIQLKPAQDKETKLYLTTKVPTTDQMVSRYTIGSLPFATLSDPAAGYQTLTTYLIEPGNSKLLSNVVRYVATVPDGTLIKKPVCEVQGMIPQIDTAVASCGDVNGGSLSMCRAYATNDANPDYWAVHMQVFTQVGWEKSDANLDKIQVITKCQKS